MDRTDSGAAGFIADFFGPPISIYTRAEALEDGVLVEVDPQLVREAGIRYPVAMTRALFDDIEAIPEPLAGLASVEGRLWDMLYMLRLAARRTDDSDMVFTMVLPIAGDWSPTEDGGEDEWDEIGALYRIRAVCGPGDDLEPVITLMRPDES